MDDPADPRRLVREAEAALSAARRLCVELAKNHGEAERALARISAEWGEASKRLQAADQAHAQIIEAEVNRSGPFGRSF